MNRDSFQTLTHAYGLLPMAISLTEDFVTVEELRADFDAALKQVHRTGRPVVVTVKGKPDVVIIDATVYETRLKTVNFAQMIAQAEAEVRLGLSRPIEEVFKEVKRAKKVSR
jgi:prevent-host-death family protein